jgi:predicted O-methyltransferase YrrM
MEIDEIKKSVRKVQGWLTDKEGELLYNFAKNCTGKGVIVEIGSWKGKSTIWLGKGSKSGNKVKVYAIDPHVGSSEHRRIHGNIWTFEEFAKNIKNAEVDDIIVPIVKTSKEASKDFHKPVELIFIDGAHEYELVKLDFKLWFPKVIEGGIMAFHDSVWGDYLGPKKVVEAFMYKSENFRNVGFLDSITFGEKVRQNSIKDKLRNRYVLVLSNHSILRRFHFLILSKLLKKAPFKIKIICSEPG